jgi:hypothetical protein
MLLVVCFLRKTQQPLSGKMRLLIVLCVDLRKGGGLFEKPSFKQIYVIYKEPPHIHRQTHLSIGNQLTL